jgi:hypothetical protein
MLRYKNLIAWIVLVAFLSAPSTIAFAQESDADGDGEGDYVELKENEAAPFDGYLLHKNAMVKLITDKQHEVESLKLTFETEKKKLNLDLETLTKKKDLELSINKDMYETLLKIKQDRVDQLASEQKWGDAKLIGGVVIGFAVSIAMFYTAVQVTR